MARCDDMETSLKLKLPNLESENKTLIMNFQRITEKNFELVRSYTQSASL